MDKICFVIMGFGKKTDYSNGSEVDLDIIYNLRIWRFTPIRDWGMILNQFIIMFENRLKL